jgi:hypothetical protein
VTRETWPAGLTRHRDFETTQRYIRIDDELTRKTVESIDFNLKSNEISKSPTQKSHTNINVLLPYMTNPLCPY